MKDLLMMTLCKRLKQQSWDERRPLAQDEAKGPQEHRIMRRWMRVRPRSYQLLGLIPKTTVVTLMGILNRSLRENTWIMVRTVTRVMQRQKLAWLLCTWQTNKMPQMRLEGEVATRNKHQGFTNNLWNSAAIAISQSTWILMAEDSRGTFTTVIGTHLWERAMAMRTTLMIKVDLLHIPECRSVLMFQGQPTNTLYLVKSTCIRSLQLA